MKIEEIIGDYRTFFADLCQRLRQKEIDIEGRQIVQLLYRTQTLLEYESIRDRLKFFCKEFVETSFNGRAISILILKEPLILENEVTVSVIELPAPRPAHTYPSGLESVGILVGDQLAEFNYRYRSVLTGVKDHGQECQPAFVTFENDKTVKFYDRSLQEIILLKGWRFEQLCQSVESPLNQEAQKINSLLHYLHGIDSWEELVKDVNPKKRENGLIYELPHPLGHLDQSFAIVDMRALSYCTQPHYHCVRTHNYFVLEGSGIVVVGGKERVVGKTSVVTIDPPTAHYTLSQGLVLAVMNIPPFSIEDHFVLREDNESVGFKKNQFDRLRQRELALSAIDKA